MNLSRLFKYPDFVFFPHYFLCLLFCCFPVFVSATLLSDEQARWLKQHPVAVVGGSPDWTPFNFVDESGQYSGIANDYLQLISRKTGLKFKVSIDTWHNNLEKIKNKQIDVLPAVYYTRERSQYLIFSKPYFEVLDYFFIRSDINAKKLSDLDGLRVAIPAGYAHIQLLKKYFPKINIVTVDTFGEAIDAVLERKADLLYDTYGALVYSLQQQGINTIVPFKSTRDIVGINPIHIVTRNDKPLLASIIETGLAAITPAEKNAIYQKWLGFGDILAILTSEQKNWLNHIHTLRFAGAKGQLPFEDFDEQGQYMGIAADFLKLIQQQLNISIEILPYQNNQQLKKLFRQDAVDFVIKSEFPGMIHSQAFASGPVIIVMRNTENYVDSLYQILDKKIAVIKDADYLEQIEDEFPKELFNTVPDIKEGLTSVSTGKMDALVLPLAQAGFYIAEMGLNNIRIVGKTGYYFQRNFAVPENNPVLQGILNSALQNINQTDRNNIFEKWGKYRFAERVDYKALFISAVIFLLILSFVGYWNRKLAFEIKRRKLLEQQLIRAKDNAEAANRAKSKFLANMSHEIRTPMNAILGFTELLEEQVKDPKHRAFIRTIHSASQNLMILINDILDLSKIEADKLEIKKKVCNPAALFQDIANIFSIKMHEKNLDFKLDIDSDIPESLILDEVRLRQVLFNLIGNAVNFTERGSVCLKAYKANEDESHSRLDLIIEVTDTGIGIGEENKRLVFQAFEQPHEQDQKKFGGSGLGLSISKRLVEMMGGQLELESEVEKGSTFRIKLNGVDIAPCLEAETPAQSVQDETLRFTGGHILIVDDVAENCNLIESILAETVLKIQTASNGKQAVHMAKEQAFDLIIMDIKMPLMDGREAAERIHSFSQVPIIALSASENTQDSPLQKEPVFAAYCHKPINKHELLRVLKQFLPTVTKADHANGVPELTVSAKEVEKLPELVGELQALSAHCEKIAKNNNLSELQQFAEQLNEIAQRIPVACFKEYALQLTQAIDSVDIMAIKQLLDNYQPLIEQLRNYR